MRTAVEWYNEEHFNLLIKLHNEVINIHEYTLKHYDILQQAKKMEKNNLYECGSFWRGKENKIEKPFFEQYYNETFKSE